MADDFNFDDEMAGAGFEVAPEAELDLIDSFEQTTEAPVEEAVVAETVVESPAAEEPSPAEEPPAEPAEKTELDYLKEQNAALLAKLNEVLSKKEPAPVPQQPVAQQPTPPTQPPATTETPVDIFDGQDFDDVLSDKVKFTTMLGKFGELVARHIYSTVSGTLGNVIDERVEYRNNMKAIADDFYSANEDLKAVKPVVSSTMREIQAENPDKPLTEILTLTAEKVRTMLALTKAGKPPATQSASIPPAAPSQSSTRMSSTSGTKPAGVSDELEALKGLGF